MAHPRCEWVFSDVYRESQHAYGQTYQSSLRMSLQPPPLLLGSRRDVMWHPRAGHDVQVHPRPTFVVVDAFRFQSLPRPHVEFLEALLVVVVSRIIIVGPLLVV